MAFNAQFFQLNPQSSLADDISSGYKAGYEMREGERKKTLQNTYSKMLTSAGTLPTEFIQETAKQGIGMEGLEKYFENLKGNVGTAKQVAEDSSMLEMLGRTPDAGREWNNQKPKEWIETKTNQISAAKDYNTMSYDQLAAEEKDLLSKVSKIDSDFTNKLLAENKNLPIGERIQNLLKYAGNPTATKIETPIVQVETPESYKQPTTSQPTTSQPTTSQPTTSASTGTEMDLGYGNIIATVPKPTPNYRQYSAVEEMLRRSGKGPADAFGSAGSAGSSFSSDLTKWEPENNGTNEYRQYAKALSDSLSANGFKSASDYLTKIGEQTYNQNLYVPNQMAMYGKDGKPDRAALGAEIAKYEQSKIVAKAKAEEAILKARDALTAKAKEFGVATIGSEVEKDRQEAHEADYAGRRAEGLQFRPVTQAEAAKGRDIVAKYLDIRDGLARGGFEGAYAAALAKAGLDGSVNSDAIVANLISMGAVPSNKAVFVKNLMNPTGTVSSDAWGQLKSLFGNFVFAEAGASKKWGEDAKQNAAETAKMYGFTLPGDKPAKTGGTGEPAPKKTSAADVVGGSPKAKTGKTNYPKGTDSKGRAAL